MHATLLVYLVGPSIRPSVRHAVKIYTEILSNASLPPPTRTRLMLLCIQPCCYHLKQINADDVVVYIVYGLVVYVIT